MSRDPEREPSPSEPRAFARCDAVTLFACIAAILIPCLVFIGWIFDLEALKRIVPGLVSMNPLTAACFILCGVSLWALRGARENRMPVLAGALALAVALIALLKISGLILGFDLMLDQWMFHDKLAIDAVRKNEMAPTTALNFLLLALALLLADVETRTGRRPAQWLALFVTLVALLALIGYCYGVKSLTGLASFIPMALHTAFCFVVLAIGLLCARPEHGLMARATRASDGGAMVRQILWIIVGAPLVLGWLILAGQRAGSYNAEFAFSLFVIAVVTVFATLIWTNVVSLDRKENERRGADDALREAHDELERRVEDRTGELSQVLAEIVKGIAVLGSSAEKIVQSSSHLAETASGSAAALNETTTTIEELRQTAHLADEKARSVAESARAAATISETGKQATEKMRTGTQRIASQMDSIAGSMTRLDEQSRAIAGIIAVVEDLAQQSKLLAVNAAIEAAKAGEQGKGFGVVAEEVRFLAAQSRKATGQVRKILGDIQKATAEAVASTGRGGKAVESGVRRSQQASDAIFALAERVAEAAETAAQIAASSREQLTGLDQVVDAMQQIQAASTQDLDTVTQLNASAQNLETLGVELEKLAARHRPSA